MGKAERAADFADRAHKGQTRKWGNSDKPYTTHTHRVARMVAEHPDSNEDMVVAAELHDILEDTSVTADELARLFGFGVSDLVVWLTNPSKGMKAPRAERKRIDREHIAKAPDAARLIKLCDRIDNLRDIENDPQTPQDFAKLYVEESFLLWKEALMDTDESIGSQFFALLMRLKGKT